jgi:hypothetical protein
MNRYIALVEKGGACRVTLPAGIWGTRVDDDGVISGLTGAASMWNGSPPPWCYSIVEVRSPKRWDKVTDDEKTVIWRRS